MNCPDENRLLEYATGGGRPEARVAMEAHVDVCSSCRRVVAEAARTVGPTRPAGDWIPGPTVQTAERGAGGGGLAPGERVGDFRVIRRLGAGGMGAVYLARDERLGRRVALKIIRPDHGLSQQAVAQFLDEARTTARFSHPNIVTVYSVGEHQGAPYLALEYLKGQALRERLLGERFGVSAAARVALAIARATEEAHAGGVLHRDLKPENVILPSDGRLRVLDFGLARIRPRAWAAERAAKATSVAGTPAYMAPEQFEGRAVPASDVWALGIMLWEMFTGEHPYLDRGVAYEALPDAIRSATPAPTLPEEAGIPAPLARLVVRCLDKVAERRPTASEVAGILEAILAGARTQGMGEGPEEGPFRGLLAYGEAQASTFFGRSREVAALAERLRDEPVVTVVGPSGGGKSSLIQAGLIPRLREQGPWTVVRLRPGAAPFRALVSALSNVTRMSGRSAVEDDAADPAELAQHPGRLGVLLARLAERRRTRILLFVDQLEEAVTLVADPETRRRFLESICAAAVDPSEPVRVVQACRDDFLGRVAVSPRVAAVLTRVVVVRGPDESAQREILTRSVQRVGYTWESPELIDQIVGATAGQPASLPIVQVTGSLLWARRDRAARRLTRAAFDAIGGVDGALATHAEAVLAGLGPADVDCARQLLLRLVTPQRTRRLVRRSPLLEGLGHGASALLDRLVEGRLLVVRKPDDASADGEEFELIHESLIGSWPQLATWIDDGREDLVFLADARQAAELWVRRGRDAADLWHGSALDAAQTHLARASAAVPDDVRAFVRRGVARRDRLRRRRVALAGLFVAALLAALVFVVAQRERAEAAREVAVVAQSRAEQSRATAERRRVNAMVESARAAQRGGRAVEARARLRSAMELEVTDAGRALWWSLSRGATESRIELGRKLFDLARLPDGSAVLVSTLHSDVYRVDTATGRWQALGIGPHGPYLGLGPRGQTLAYGQSDGGIGLLTLGSGARRPLIEQRAGAPWVRDVTIAPDGHRLVASDDQGGIQLIALDSSRVEASATQRGGVTRVEISPDGTKIATAGRRGAVRLWDDALEPIRRWRIRGRRVAGLVFSPDGRSLAFGGTDGTIYVADVDSESAPKELPGHTDWITALAFSPDGSRLASGSKDRTLRIWALGAGTGAEPIVGHSRRLTSLVWLGGNDRLASAGFDGQLRVWRAGGRGTDELDQGHLGTTRGVAFSPDGRRVATGGADSTVRLWDARTGRQLQVLRGHGDGVNGVAFAPDGAALASASADRSVRVWDAKTGAPRVTLFGHTNTVVSALFEPDGKRLLSWSFDGTVRRWELASGRTERVIAAHNSSVWSVCLRPGGRELVTTDAGRVRRWQVDTGERLGSIRLTMATNGGLACLADGRVALAGAAGIQMWSPNSDTLRPATSGNSRVAALLAVSHDGALVGTTSLEGHAWLLDLSSGRERALLGHRGATQGIALSPDGQHVVASGQDGTVRAWRTADGTPLWSPAAAGPSDRPRAPVPVPAGLVGATTASRVFGGLLVGYSTGHVRAHGAQPDGRVGHLQSTPLSPVEALREGPAGTVLVGFSSGEIGVWGLYDGVPIVRGHLHGAVRDVTERRGVLYVVSELGSQLALDLTTLQTGPCELLRRLWAEVPVVWTREQITAQAPPAGHPCAVTAPKDGR